MQYPVEHELKSVRHIINMYIVHSLTRSHTRNIWDAHSFAQYSCVLHNIFCLRGIVHTRDCCLFSFRWNIPMYRKERGKWRRQRRRQQQQTTAEATSKFMCQNFYSTLNFSCNDVKYTRKKYTFTISFGSIFPLCKII